MNGDIMSLSKKVKNAIAIGLTAAMITGVGLGGKAVKSYAHQKKLDKIVTEEITKENKIIGSFAPMYEKAQEVKPVINFLLSSEIVYNNNGKTIEDKVLGGINSKTDRDLLLAQVIASPQYNLPIDDSNDLSKQMSYLVRAILNKANERLLKTYNSIVKEGVTIINHGKKYRLKEFSKGELEDEKKKALMIAVVDGYLGQKENRTSIKGTIESYGKAMGYDQLYNMIVAMNGKRIEKIESGIRNSRLQFSSKYDLIASPAMDKWTEEGLAELVKYVNTIKNINNVITPAGPKKPEKRVVNPYKSIFQQGTYRKGGFKGPVRNKNNL